MEHKRIHDDISKGFADLTGLLESTAALAAEGQSLRCESEDRVRFAALIWPEGNEIVRVLAATERRMEICQRD